MEILSLFVFYLLGCGVHAESHSLRYYFSTVLSSIPEVPIFSVVGHVDDIQCVKYTSDEPRALPTYKWMETGLGTEHWEELTNLGHYFSNSHKHFARLIASLHNQTIDVKDVHTFQVKFACELHEDGSIDGYQEYGFNGKEFIVFDKDRLVYIPVTQEAQFITQRWNRNRALGARDKAYIEKDCIRWIKQFFHHGNEELYKKVRPQVHISEHKTEGITKLHCQVFGFYPRNVDVKWMRNESDEVYTDEAKTILPNPDGTYQLKVTVDVTPEDGDNYFCHVDHSSLENIMIIQWEPGRSKSPISWIIVVVPAALILAAICAAIVTFKKKSAQHQRVNTLEPG
ncbi:major histocompatibility complex class I-related gene protein [Bombina bombina]|uniref:major histocompatibility complex class I-related gene protein n=1 Tax=Bombina bombina TaxID=8345 RepID=UPI00235A7E75|nr:major histocompatibility complex class I-related gene protein [Bombina bombina]